MMSINRAPGTFVQRSYLLKRRLTTPVTDGYINRALSFGLQRVTLADYHTLPRSHVTRLIPMLLVIVSNLEEQLHFRNTALALVPVSMDMIVGLPASRSHGDKLP